MDDQEKRNRELLEEIEKLKRQVKTLKSRKKYGLVWESEKEPEQIVLNCQIKIPILKQLKNKEIITDKEKPQNILIEGDNYHSLSVLNYTHKGKIDLIYIDPPYNTGNEGFIYNDKIVDINDSYRHTKWLAFMEKRLKLAKELLKKNGTIFISIDENEFAQLKLLCDAIFDEKNYIIDIVWNSRKSVSSDAIISLNHNHTLLYARDIELLREEIKKGYKFKLPANEEKFSNPDNDTRGPWVADPFEAAGVRKNLSYPIKNPNTEEIFRPVKGRHWAVLEEEYFKLFKDGRIVFGKNGKGKPSRKRFLSDAMEKGLTPKSIWDDVGTTTNGTQELENILGDKKFNNPKPVSLIRRILELATDKKSIVLDFMAGSGTTGHAVLEANKDDSGNRQFILCTNNENNNGTGFKIATDICYPRIEKVIKGYNDLKNQRVGGVGGNLRYFKTELLDVEHISHVSDEQKIKLTYQAGEMIALREGTFEEVEKDEWWQIFKDGTKYAAIYFKEDKIKLNELVKKLSKLKEMVVLYIFSWGKNEYKNEFTEYKNIKVEDIPEPIIDVYKEVNRLS